MMDVLFVSYDMMLALIIFLEVNSWVFRKHLCIEFAP
jgi:energy-converting hydrogenase Eha subunit E